MQKIIPIILTIVSGVIGCGLSIGTPIYSLIATPHYTNFEYLHEYFWFISLGAGLTFLSLFLNTKTKVY